MRHEACLGGLSFIATVHSAAIRLDSKLKSTAQCAEPRIVGYLAAWITAGVVDTTAPGGAEVAMIVAATVVGVVATMGAAVAAAAGMMADGEADMTEGVMVAAEVAAVVAAVAVAAEVAGQVNLEPSTGGKASSFKSK